MIANAALALNHGWSPRITKEETKVMIGSPELKIIDVRKPISWAGSSSKIQSAVRRDPGDLQWIEKYHFDQTLVMYCDCPNEATSANVAQELRIRGYEKAYALRGGWNEWRDAKYPVQNK